MNVAVQEYHARRLRQINKPFKFIHASILVVMNPSHAVEVANTSHVFGKLLGLRPTEVVDDWNNVAVGI